MNPKRVLPLLLLVLASACGRFSDDQAAFVDGRPITFAALADAVKLAQGSQQGGQQDPAEVQRQALLSLIQQELLRAQAVKNNIVITDAEIDKTLTQIKGQFASQDQFDQAVKQRGLTAETLRVQLRQQLAVQALQKKLAPVTVTDADVKALYEERKDTYQEAHVRHILFAIEKQTEAQALAKAKDTLAKIRAGESFTDLAKKLTDDPGSKDKGGDYGFIAKGQFVPEFDKAMFTLPLKTVSEPVKTQFGYHLIEVLARRTTTLKQASAGLREEITNQKGQSAFQKVVMTMVAESNIEVNPRIGDFDPVTLKIVPHQFFVPSSPEPGLGDDLGGSGGIPGLGGSLPGGIGAPPQQPG